MLKSLSGLALTVGLLVSGCGTPGVVAKPTPPCWVPLWPDPPTVVLVEPCDLNAVCISKDSAVDIGLWVRAVTDYHLAVLACPGVER